MNHKCKGCGCTCQYNEDEIEYLQGRIKDYEEKLTRSSDRIAELEADRERAFQKSVKNYEEFKALQADLVIAIDALQYCSVDDDMAIDQQGKLDSSSANEWKRQRARATLHRLILRGR